MGEQHTEIRSALWAMWTSDVVWRPWFLLGMPIPWLLSLLAINTVAGDCMKRGTANLVSSSSALTANLVNQIMRFVALFISACIVNAPPYPKQVPFLSGALFLLAGGLGYSLPARPSLANTGPAPADDVQETLEKPYRRTGQERRTATPRELAGGSEQLEVGLRER